MANRKQVALLKQGVAEWNEWRNTHPDVQVDLDGSSWVGHNFDMAALENASLRTSMFDRCTFVSANLASADMRGARFADCNFTLANLSDSDFRTATFSNVTMVMASFTHTRLNGAHLLNVDLRNSYFNDATLEGSQMQSVNLSEAELTSVSLQRVDLTGASLVRSTLNNVDFRRATLSRADFTLADIGWNNFADVDLSTAIGLETIQHFGPSTVGIDTLYRTGIGIPESFLRGAGVPDTFMEYHRALIGNPVEFYSCFISYSTKDQAFAERLHNDLQAKGVRCWFAPHDLKAGQKLHEQIDDAIRLHEKLLLILSQDSINSEWVRTEIAKARKREVKENRRVLFPISLVDFSELKEWECFDSDIGKDSAREIREYYIPDFSMWKSDADEYQREFEKLLKSLKSVTT